MVRPHSLSDVLDHVVENTDGERVSLGDILTALDTGSYGPMLLFICVISMLPPMSVTPGLPVVTGTLILGLCVQLLIMRRQPWLPKRILRFSISREKLLAAIERARPWMRRLGRIVRPRLTIFLEPPMLNVIALICCVLALSIFPLAVLPGGENIPAAAVLFFGLALTAKDGVLALLGLTIAAASFGLLIYFWTDVMQGLV